MLKLENGANGKAANAAPTHETTGLFFPQFIPIPGPLTGQMQLMLVPGSGIPMRDYYAAKIAGAIAGTLDGNGLDDYAAIARDAYRLADRLLDARKHEPKGFPYTDGDLCKIN